MTKRLRKRELYSKEPLSQLFHRYVPIHDDGNAFKDKDTSETPETDTQKGDVKGSSEAEIVQSTSRSNTTWTGVTYYRDPYQTDSDQSVDGGSSDLDTEGNIIEGGTRKLTPEEFEEYISNMGETKDNDEKEDEDITASQDHHNDHHDDSDTKQERKHIDAIYIEEEVNAMEYLEDDYESWLADTGASCHVTYNDDKLHNVMSNGRDKVIVGDQRPCEVSKKGNLTLISEENDKLLKLLNVRIVKAIGKNIMSIGTLLKDGGIMEGNERTMTIKIIGTKLIFEKNEIDGLYNTKMKRIKNNK